LALLKLLGFSNPASADASLHGGARCLPYRRRDDFLSPAELSFYRVLVTAVGNRAVICPKVNLADVVFVSGGTDVQKFRNKIDRKHADFLLCRPETLKPLCAIELDDASHKRRDRQDRDGFVDKVFAAADLPLVRVPAKSGYSISEIRLHMEPYIAGIAVLPRDGATIPGTVPECPKCGITMVERTSKKGLADGQAFFGCVNYPQCRETAQR
jgi:hypothetical protein